MDIGAAQAIAAAQAMAAVQAMAAAQAPVAPWIAVGILLALAAVLLAGLLGALVARRRAASRTATRAADVAPPPGLVEDDLPAFLESPPGSAPAGPVRGGFVALAAPPTPPAPPAPPPPARSVTGPMLAAAAGVSVLLLAAAAVIAGLSAGSGQRSAGDGTDPAPAAAGEARLRFAAVVLTEHEVGVTVSRPELVVDAGRSEPAASLVLPTWNCLTFEAPEDPVAAGCAPARTEYAELRGPALDVTGTEDGLRLAGDFPTSTRPADGTVEPTGRTYQLEVTVTAYRELSPDRWSPAGGTMLLEDRPTESVEGGMRADA